MESHSQQILPKVQQNWNQSSNNVAKTFNCGSELNQMDIQSRLPLQRCHRGWKKIQLYTVSINYAIIFLAYLQVALKTHRNNLVFAKLNVWVPLRLLVVIDCWQAISFSHVPMSTSMVFSRISSCMKNWLKFQNWWLTTAR